MYTSATVLYYRYYSGKTRDLSIWAFSVIKFGKKYLTFHPGKCRCYLITDPRRALRLNHYFLHVSHFACVIKILTALHFLINHLTYLSLLMNMWVITAITCTCNFKEPFPCKKLLAVQEWTISPNFNNLTSYMYMYNYCTPQLCQLSPGNSHSFLFSFPSFPWNGFTFEKFWNFLTGYL